MFVNSEFKNIVIEHHIMQTGKSKNEVLALWRGLNQFLRLVALKESSQVAPEPVDQLWHHMLQFTEDYSQYCKHMFGQMIHHKPATIPGQPSGYLETRKLALEMYGQLDPNIWPLEERKLWSIGYVIIDELPI